MKVVMMRTSCNKALCSYVLCFGFFYYCCGFIVVHFGLQLSNGEFLTFSCSLNIRSKILINVVRWKFDFLLKILNWLGYLCVEKLEFTYHEDNNCYNKDLWPLMGNHLGLMFVVITNFTKKFSYFFLYSISCLTSSIFINQTFKSSLNTMQRLYWNCCH
jgi:hypothetical protein